MSSTDSRNIVWRSALWVLASAVVGAAAFIVGQGIAGFPMNIAEFIGAEIVQRGGYSAWLAGPIGWGVHLSVSVTYAALFAAIVLALFFPRERTARWGAALGLAAVLGWLTTLVTMPAIAVTIGVLSGQGIPSPLPGLNTSFGPVFWNHIAFFAVSFAITVVLRDTVRARRAVGSVEREPAGAVIQA